MQAFGGMMAITGEPTGPSAKVGAPIPDPAAALFLAMSVTSALLRCEKTGCGARLDISLYDSVLGLMANQSMNWLLAGADTPRPELDHPVLTPYVNTAPRTDR